MARVPAPEVEPEVQRKEREPDPLVLREVPQLMAPDRRRRLARGDDDVTERDRREAPSRQHEPREAAVDDVEEAAVPESGAGAGEESQRVAERISVVAASGMKT